jgi:hypothetical protein
MLLQTRTQQVARLGHLKPTWIYGASYNSKHSVNSQNSYPTLLFNFDRNNAFLGLVRTILPKLPSIFPSSQAQSAAFGPAAYLLGGTGGGLQVGEIGSQNDREGMMMDAMDGEVWGLIAALVWGDDKHD